MKIKILVIYFIFPYILYGQDSPIFPDFPVFSGYIKYSVEKRMAFYPFSKASHIKIVSFHWQKDTLDGKLNIIYRIPMLNDTICQSKLDQIIPISASQTDTLNDLLYNTCYKWTTTDTTEIFCYLPRNAIIFYTKDDKPCEYIEICFECHGIIRSNKLITMPGICDVMYNELERFFQKLGLKTSGKELMRETFGY